MVAAPDGQLLTGLRASLECVGVLPIPYLSTRSRSWLEGARLLAREFRGKKELLFHANGLSALNLIAPVAHQLNAPVAIHFHASEIGARAGAALKVWKRLGVTMRFFPVSDFNRKLLNNAGVGHLVGGVLPNPLECSDYHLDRPRTHEPFRVGFVGSNLPNKGLDLFVRIASRLADENVEWHVFGIDIPGDLNNYVSKCMSAITDAGLRERFKWRGVAEVPADAYPTIDAVVIPSRRESFSRVALEGMAAGVPVVASRIPGITETVEEGVSGMLFDLNNPAEAATHLLAVMKDSGLREKFLSHGYRRAQQFDISRVAPILEAFYRDLISGAPQPTPAVSR